MAGFKIIWSFTVLWNEEAGIKMSGWMLLMYKKRRKAPGVGV